MPLSAFLHSILPAVAGMIGLSCYILVDTLFVSAALGAGGLAALNLSISIFSLISGVGQMAGVGGGTDCALRRGAGKSGSPAFAGALRFGACASICFFLAGLFCPREISLLLGADDATLALTQTYVRMTLLFAPAYILNAILQGFARNDGAPRLAMASMLLSSAANIVLDYLFMFPLRMGMFGAVLATGLSACMSIALLMTHFAKSTLRPAKAEISLHELARLLSCGLSALIGELASAISLITFNLLLMHIGGYIAVAAYGVIANVALVAASVFTGLGQGLQPLASHAYGAGDSAADARLRRMTAACTGALSILLFAAVFLFADPIAAAFNSEGSRELAQLAAAGLRIYFAGYLFAGVNIAAAAYLSAVARPGRALCLSLLRSCVLLVPAAVVCSTSWGVGGVWLSFPMTEAAVCALSLAFLHRA